jgi:hypothetical protein
VTDDFLIAFLLNNSLISKIVNIFFKDIPTFLQDKQGWYQTPGAKQFWSNQFST